jgi:hypothetical protein
MKNGGLDVVEESAPSESEKEAAHRVKARYVGAPATPAVIVHHRKGEKI